MRKIISIALFLSVLVITPAANAIKIKNFDDVDRQITVINGGEEKVVTIKPGKFYFTVGPNVIIKNGDQKPVRARFREEYIINNNKVIISKRNSRDR